MTHPSAPLRRRVRPSRRSLLRLGLVVGLTLGVIALLAGLAGLRAADEARRAQGVLVDARAGQPSAPDLVRSADTALVLLGRAEARLAGLPARLVGAVPILGRSLRAERGLVVSARDAVLAVRTAGLGVEHLRTADGAVDLAALTRLAEQLDAATTRSERSIAALRQVPTGLTPPQVSRTVRTGTTELADVTGSLRQATLGATLAAGLLGAQGDRHLMIALQNNSELRGTGGYVRSFAEGRATKGRVQVDPLRDIQEINEEPAVARRVPAPAEFRQDYGVFLADTTALVNWNMTPDVPTAARVLATTGRLLLPQPPDVVLMLDVPGIVALANLGGPVRLPGGEQVTPDELGKALLVDAYAQSGTSGQVQEQRGIALREAASRVVGPLLTSDLPPLRVLQVLDGLARGRHLALWSARAKEEQALGTLGLSGGFPDDQDDLLGVSINNLGANKLDQYAERRVSVEAVVGLDSADVTQRLTLRNRTPAGLVPYVAGPHEYGLLTERAQFDLPAQAQVLSLTVDGRPAPAQLHPGTPRTRTRVATSVVVHRGGRTEVVLRYRVPVRAGRYRLALVPQPLVTDARLHLELRPAPGTPRPAAPLVRNTAFPDQETVDYRASRPDHAGWLRRFLREPVHLG